MVRRSILTAALVIISAGGGYVAASAADAPTPKGYIIAEIDVTDAPTYQTYANQVPPIVAKFGGRYLARGGNPAALEGAAPTPRAAIIEFQSRAAAETYYRSAEYQAITPIRQRSSSGRLFLVEGTPPTP